MGQSCWSRFISEGIVARVKGHTGTRCTSKWLWLWISLCHNRYTPVSTLAHRQTLADNGKNTITYVLHMHTLRAQITS